MQRCQRILGINISMYAHFATSACFHGDAREELKVFLNCPHLAVMTTLSMDIYLGMEVFM